MLKLGEAKEQPLGCGTFEIVVVMRDKDNIPTGHVKTLQTDSAAHISDFWQRNRSKIKRKKKTKGPLPSASQATKIVEDVEKYREEKHSDRLKSMIKREDRSKDV